MTMRLRGLGALLIVLSVVLAAGEASAQAAPCVDLCRIPCVKPISMADRWDDLTGIPGYMGELVETRLRPDWRNNAQYDFESFTDANANKLYDPGEPFNDQNGNAVYDAELYDPLTTGYSASGDQGLVIVLHPFSTDPPTAGQYFSVGLPPVNKGTPLLDSGSYNFAWTDCAPLAVEPPDVLQPTPGGMSGPTNQRMRDLIGADFNAHWDDATKSVLDSEFPLSPRVWFIPVHDPRIPVITGSPNLVVRKVVAFFAESMTGTAMCRGRLLRVQAPGESCAGGSAGGFVVDCPVPAPATSWGQVKAAYR